MFYGKLNFERIPEIGFALQHYSKEYGTSYGRSNGVSVEIAYISSGKVEIFYKGQKITASEGSILVLFRNLDITTKTSGQKIQSHYTVLAEFDDAELEILDDNSFKTDGLIVPFVTPFCAKTENIVSKICSIAAQTADNRENNMIFASVDFLSVLNDIAKNHKESYLKNKSYNYLSQKVCDYIDKNLHQPIRVEEIAKAFSKSPNYIGCAFKKANGISINEYANNQKMKKAALMMQCDNISFKDAVNQMGIKDVSYGYRLFKKYFGLSPQSFASVKSIKRKNLDD